MKKTDKYYVEDIGNSFGDGVRDDLRLAIRRPNKGISIALLDLNQMIEARTIVKELNKLLKANTK